MEETLTECLVNIRDDLGELQRIREYLDSKSQSETQESCSMTWRTIEVFNSILAICASQDTPDSQALEILLDSFNYIASNNIDKNVWNNFGFELGIISVKILTAIEQTDIFDTLFCKLLTVINTICEYNSELWKAVARQILNVFINKKFSFSYLEATLKLYICILRNVESTDLYNFAQQNLHLLKTFSMLVQRIGDFETQIDIMELVFLHIMDDTKLIQNFFIDPKNQTSTLLNKLQFSNFEKDCRIFLNELNKNLGIERKVFTISCHKLILGGCSLEPPLQNTSIWMDGNKDSKRISIKCADFQSDPDTLVSQCVVYLQFQDIISVKLEYGTMSETSCYCLTFDTKNLDKMFKAVKNNEIICIALEVENSQEEVLEFINFLENMIKRENLESKSEKTQERMSQTCDEVCIDRDKILKEPDSSSYHEVQNIPISKSINEKPDLGIKYIMPDALKFTDKVQNKSNTNINETDNHKEKTETELQGHSRYLKSEELLIITPTTNDQIFSSHAVIRKQNHTGGKLSPKKIQNSLKNKTVQSPIREDIRRNIVPESQELTPNSFVESLNRSLGIENQEIRSSYEESIEKLVTAQFNLSSEKKRHRLFKSPNEVFDFLVEDNQDIENLNVFEDLWENKENEPFREKLKIYPTKVYKPRKVKIAQKPPPTTRVLRGKANKEAGVTDLSSEKYIHKKPVTPLNRSEPDKSNLRVDAPHSSSQKSIREETVTSTTKGLQDETNLQVGVIDSSSQKYFQEEINGFESKRKPSLPKLNRGDKRKKIPDRQFKVDDKAIKKRGKGRPRKLKARSQLNLVWTSKKLEKEVVASTTMKPSLLDPNGYAYQRWKMPTTSERSKFWLNKLDSMKKQKQDSTSVFDFSEDSESEIKNKQEKKKDLKTRKIRRNKPRKNNLPKTKTPLKDIKNILKTGNYTKLHDLPTRENEIKTRLKTNNDKLIQVNDKNNENAIRKNASKEYNLNSDPRKKNCKLNSINNKNKGSENSMELSKANTNKITTEGIKSLAGITSSNITGTIKTSITNTQRLEKKYVNTKLSESTNQTYKQNEFNTNKSSHTSTRIDKNLNLPIDDYIEHYVSQEEFNLQNKCNKNENHNKRPPCYSSRIIQNKENIVSKTSAETTRRQLNKVNIEENFPAENLRNEEQIICKGNITVQDNIDKRINRDLKKKNENYSQNKLDNNSKLHTEANTKPKTSREKTTFQFNQKNTDANFPKTLRNKNEIHNTSRKNKRENANCRLAFERSGNNITVNDLDDKERCNELDEPNTTIKSRIHHRQITAQTTEDIFKHVTKEITSTDKVSVERKVSVAFKAKGLRNSLKNNNVENIENTNKECNRNFWESVIRSSKENTLQIEKNSDSDNSHKTLSERISVTTAQNPRMFNIQNRRNLSRSPSNEKPIYDNVERSENQNSSSEIDNYQDDIVKNSWKAPEMLHQNDADFEENSESSNCTSDRTEYKQTMNYDNLISRRSCDESSDEDKETNLNEIEEMENTSSVEADYDGSEVNQLEKEKEKSELELSSEDEIMENIDTKKRDRSDEESSSSRIRTKKKTRTIKDYNLETLPLGVRLRLRKFEEKFKKETNEIIEVVDRATNQLYNHIQRKEVGEVKTYLTTAEEVCSSLDESQDLENRAKRIKRVIAYYKAGCSVSDYCGSVEDQLSQIRHSLKDLTDNSKNTSKKIDRFSNGLKSLINSDIKEKIREEFLMSQKRLLQLTSSFDI